MPGKYLRKRERSKPQDPTMTHVDDPSVFCVGDYIRDTYGYDLIIAIDENVYPNTRFAHIIENVRPPRGAVIHDVRENDRETHGHY